MGWGLALGPVPIAVVGTVPFEILVEPLGRAWLRGEIGGRRGYAQHRRKDIGSHFALIIWYHFPARATWHAHILYAWRVAKGSGPWVAHKLLLLSLALFG